MPLPLPQLRLQPKPNQAFTFAEVLVSIVIAVLFGAAAFATNNRLLVALKDQKEQTASTMFLQERMEKFRAFGYSNIADPTYVSSNILGTTTTSEATLGGLTEYVTVSGVLPTGSNTFSSSDYNRWRRDSANPTGTAVGSQVSDLATRYDLIKVDIVITWTAANNRTRTRELASIFGKGNISQ